jgi:hypothetical protein
VRAAGEHGEGLVVCKVCHVLNVSEGEVLGPGYGFGAGGGVNFGGDREGAGTR